MIDLHPEALIDRMARGRLDALERARVQRHLDECDACRLELSVRSAAARHTRRRDDDAQRLDRLAAGALARAGLGASRPTDGTTRLRSGLRSRRRSAARPAPRIGPWTGFAFGAAAGLVLLLASSWIVRSGWIAPQVDERAAAQAEATRSSNDTVREAISPPASGDAQVRSRRGTADEPSQVTDEAAQEPAPSEDAEASATTTAPAGDATPRHDRRHGERPGRADEARDPAPQPALDAADAATVFSRATAMLRRGEIDPALDELDALRRRFPRSREASTSWVLSGRALLEQGRAQAALDCFSHYLDDHGAATLVPEALAGKATALTRLGRLGEAHAQWEAIVRRFPRSSVATEARARLEVQR